jgi:hypothetical protein
MALEAQCERASLRAKLAEWEAAGRVLAKEAACGRRAWECEVLMWHHELQVKHEPGLPRQWEAAERAVNANPLASRLVAEAGGTNGCPPFPPPGSDATTSDGRFMGGCGYGEERM